MSLYELAGIDKPSQAVRDFFIERALVAESVENEVQQAYADASKSGVNPNSLKDMEQEHYFGYQIAEKDDSGW